MVLGREFKVIKLKIWKILNETINMAGEEIAEDFPVGIQKDQ